MFVRYAVSRQRTWLNIGSTWTKRWRQRRCLRNTVTWLSGFYVETVTRSVSFIWFVEEWPHFHNSSEPSDVHRAAHSAHTAAIRHLIIITYAESHICNTASEADASVNQAAANKIAKYDELASVHRFHLVAIETGGTWAVELVQEISRWATLITGEPIKSMFLFEQLLIALQKGNVVNFLITFDSD